MSLFFLWIIFGFAACVVAGSKGRSVVGWFFGGILLGPIALLMVGFMPAIAVENTSPRITQTAPAERREESKICPFCAESIKKAAIVCRFCGKDQPEQPAGQTRPRTVCLKCGEDLSHKPDTCPQCGRTPEYARNDPEFVIHKVFMKKCPSCGADQPTHVKQCSSCNYEFTLAPRPLRCNECGQDISHMPDKCPKCGKKYKYKTQ